MKETGGKATNDDNPGRADSGQSKASGANPCALVSRVEAQAIIGKPIATPQEAPLGPTCIYQRLDAGSTVTIDVESVDFAKLRSLIRNRARVAVAGRTAYCGDYGRTTTFVPLGAHRMLSIAAPCAVGVRFAAKAIPRLRD
jgi:hypothetical protein